MYRQLVKPLLDFLVALGMLIMLSPVFMMLILILLINNKGHVFFLQQRPGKNEKPFYIIKFRTMLNKYDKEGNRLPDIEGLTGIGRFLRRSSLDELPQLINVLKGDLSLVGPRPLLMHYLPLYNEAQRKRHAVKPGITGWAQVNGRNATTWPERFAHDVWYVEHVSFGLDLKILWKTFYTVLTAKGAEVDLEEFGGSGE